MDIYDQQHKTMKETVIRIIPPEVYIDDFEDLLATDGLFVDYFNSFLQLPTFPEPLSFNKESGGFEILSDAKKELADQIKAAIKSGQRKKKIYRPVLSHSFSAIPLIPIDIPSDEVEKEIDTSFSVKTLNKEQGIQWVKRERLPLFLESDFYLEYRLAKLVSQVKTASNSDPSESISIKLDYTPRIRNIEEEEAEVEPPVDEGEVMMRDAYVCMGTATTTDTEAWVSQAKLAMQTSTTSSLISVRPKSAVGEHAYPRPSTTTSRPVSGRPISARSNPSISTTRRMDSGFWSPNKFGSTQDSSQDVMSYTASLLGFGDENDDIPLGGDLFDPGPKPPPMTPRPSDRVCAMAPIGGKMGNRVYASPPKLHAAKQTSQHSESEQEDQGIGDDSSVSTLSGSGNNNKNKKKPAVFENMDQLGNVIVGTVLKNAISVVTGQTGESIVQDPKLQHLFKDSEKYEGFETNNMVFRSKKSTSALSPSDKLISGNRGKESDVVSVDDEGSTSNTIIGDEKDSDEDSVLNSDNDYEEERDDFFRKHKHKTYHLKNKKGIDAFKKFLTGSLGEKNWLFWMDTERAKLISKDAEHLQSFLLAMRERYQKPGAVFELSTETKLQMQLHEPSQWTMDRIAKIQNKMAEPLVLYWAPRFLMKQKIKIRPDENVLYHQQRVMKTRLDPHPYPAVSPLLPLRPKTCMPRTSIDLSTPRASLQVTDAFQSVKNDENEKQLTITPRKFATTPPVGMKRIYSLPEAFQTPQMKREQAKPPQRKLRQKSPRKMITASLKADKSQRPASAPANFSKSSDTRKEAWELGSGGSQVDSSTDLPAGPDTTDSRRSSTSTDSGISEYAGGRRMEGLLQALHNEKKSGGIIRKFLHHINHQMWKNCLDFWEGLQHYHTLFYSDVLDPWLLKQKAKFLYSKHLSTSATKDIQCNHKIKDKIYCKLDPPFEELFDDAEEYVLSVLFDAWTEMMKSDITTFDKVELIEIKRHLSSKSKYMMSLQRRGILKERVESPEDNMEGYEDPVYDESFWEKIPPEFQDWNLDKLVHNRLELEHFKNYLAENYASMDLMAWMDIEAFRRIPHIEESKRDLKAKDVKVKYFTKKYFFGPNSPAGKEGQEKVMQAGGGWGKLLEDRPPTNSLLEAQKYVRERLEKNWLPRFLDTEEFQERQRPKIGMDDAVEDVMIQKKKKSQAIWKMLESRWISSSKDIMAFRKALINPVTSQQFRKFVSVKGDNFENDVLFYQEVQKYKDLCHIHSERSLMQMKTLAIINCFIDSAIPPTLQVDIPQEMADRLAERKMEATPYLFRESQLTIFRVLASHWNDFNVFRSNLTDEKLVPTLERHRRKARSEEKKKQKELDLKKERLETQRKAMGLPEGADMEEGFDPFTKGSDDEDNGDKSEKQAVSWSYSQYMDAFDRENVLNHVDAQTFSTLTTDSLSGSMQDLLHPVRSQDGQSETGDKLVPSKAQDEPQSRKGSAKRSSRLKLDTSEAGSQTAETKVKKVTRIMSPKERPSKKASATGIPLANGVPNIVVNQPLQDVKQKGPQSPPANGNGGPRIIRKILK